MCQIEVFRTNVNDAASAKMLLSTIHDSFGQYTANFDLDDCDKILRVKSKEGVVDPTPLIQLLHAFGFEASVLPDEIEPFSLDQLLQ